LLARKTAQAQTLDELLFAMVVLGDDRLIERTVISQAQPALDETALLQ
jgi:guanine deaminase